jgi:hypothetical protein
MIDDSQPSDPAPLIDPALLPFLDQAEFSLRDAEHHARSIYLAFSRIHPEEITPQTIETFHDLIERWYRSHRKWIGLCREQCREVEAISSLAVRPTKSVDLTTVVEASGTESGNANEPQSVLQRLNKAAEILFTAAFMVFCSLFMIAFGIICISLAFRFFLQFTKV